MLCASTMAGRACAAGCLTPGAGCSWAQSHQPAMARSKYIDCSLSQSNPPHLQRKQCCSVAALGHTPLTRRCYDAPESTGMPVLQDQQHGTTIKAHSLHQSLLDCAPPHACQAIGFPTSRVQATHGVAQRAKQHTTRPSHQTAVSMWMCTSVQPNRHACTCVCTWHS